MFSAGDSSGEGINSLNQFGSLRGSVDWAALAQQWIQMRDNNNSGTMTIPDAPPPPNISGNYLDIRTGSSKSAVSVVPLKKSTFEEKGEADMDMDEDEERASRNESPPPPAPSMQLGKTRAEVMQSQQPQSGISPAQWFVQQQQSTTQVAVAPAALAVPPVELGNGTSQHKTTPNQWNARAWPPRITLPPPTPVMQLPVVASNTNPTAHIPPLMKINVPNPNTTKTEESNSGSVTMDAAKRKILPAWIREGLEKMEREKQKQLERQQAQAKDGLDDAVDAKSEAVKPTLQPSEHTVKSKSAKFLESDSSGNEEDDHAAGASIGVGVSAGDIKALADMFTKSKTPAVLPPVPVVRKAHKVHSDDGDSETTEAEADPETDTEADRLAGVGKRSYEERLADLMIVVRRTLTELLLEVTNEEIFKISQEAVNSRKAKASSAQVIRKSALSSITGKLGLAAYDDSSGDDSSLSENETSADNDSNGDSEEELKASIRAKRRAFAKVSEEIEERIAASALRGEQKLKYYTQMEQQRLDKPDANKDNADELPQSENKAGAVAATVSKGYERDFGETTDSKLQHSNGKRQKERSSRRERTTRFSDNKDSKSVSIAAAATYISQIHTGSSSSVTTTTATASNQPTTLFPIATPAVSALAPVTATVDANNLYTAPALSGSSVAINKNLLNAAEAAIEKATKAKSDKRSDRHHRRRDVEREREHHHASHRSHGGRRSSDDDDDSSSSSSSTSNSSRHSKYSRASSTRHKRDERSASSRKRSRSRERRHRRRRHHSSAEEYDDDRSRRHGTHRSSTKRRSRSRSRSSYSSSSRRHRH